MAMDGVCMSVCIHLCCKKDLKVPNNHQSNATIQIRILLVRPGKVEGESYV